MAAFTTMALLGLAGAAGAFGAKKAIDAKKAKAAPPPVAAPAATATTPTPPPSVAAGLSGAALAGRDAAAKVRKRGQAASMLKSAFSDGRTPSGGILGNAGKAASLIGYR